MVESVWWLWFRRILICALLCFCVIHRSFDHFKGRSVTKRIVEQTPKDAWKPENLAHDKPDTEAKFYWQVCLSPGTKQQVIIWVTE